MRYTCTKVAIKPLIPAKIDLTTLLILEDSHSCQVQTEYCGEVDNSMKTITREEFIEELRTWVGTPFHHQGRWKGLGVDCAGLVVMPLANLGVKEALKADNRTYKHRPGHQLLLERLLMIADEIPASEIQPGDIMAFTIYKYPQHLAIKSYGDKVIHVTEDSGVLEEYLSDMWKKRLIGVFRLRCFKE